VIFATAHHAETGEFGFWVLRSFSTSLGAVPGPYGNCKLASVRVHQQIEAQGRDDGSGSENWVLSCGTEGELQMYLEYRFGMPEQNAGELTIRGGSDLDFRRIYKTTQGTDVVRSVPSSIDRVSSFRFEASLGEFTDTLGGNRSLISIAVDSWYIRQVFII